MTNIERWIEDLKRNGQPVYWYCNECPAEEYCKSVWMEIKFCTDIFEEWMNKEVE